MSENQNETTSEGFAMLNVDDAQPSTSRAATGGLSVAAAMNASGNERTRSVRSVAQGETPPSENAITDEPSDSRKHVPLPAPRPAVAERTVAHNADHGEHVSGSHAGSLGAALPLMYLAKVFASGLKEVMPYHRPDDMTTHIDRSLPYATVPSYTTWKVAEVYAMLGLSGESIKYQMSPDRIQFRRIAVKVVQTELPQVTPMFSDLTSLLAQAAGGYNLNNLFSNQVDVKQQSALMQLTSALASTRKIACYDEAPVARLISLMMTIAEKADVLHSNTLFPRMAYDAYLTSDTKVWRSVPTMVPCKAYAYITDLTSFFRLYHGFYKCDGWDTSDLISNVIVIPVKLNQDMDVATIAKCFAYTDTAWWAGRFVWEAKVKCANRECVEGQDVLYFCHLAALTRIASRPGDTDFKILFVADTLVTPATIFSLPDPDGTDLTIEPLVSTQRKNAKTPKTPTDITDLLNTWMRMENWGDLRIACHDVMKELCQYNVGSTVNGAFWTCAEVFASLPLDKVLTDDPSIPATNRQAFGLFSWDSKDDRDDINFQANTQPKRHASFQYELAQSGWGALKPMLEWSALACTSPLGIPCPGFINVDFNWDLHTMKLDQQKSKTIACYNLSEADNFGRLALYHGPLISVTPVDIGLAHVGCSVQYLHGASSLLAGLGAWAAVETGYSLYDMACLSPMPAKIKSTLRSGIYNMYVAGPISVATGGKVSFSYSSVSTYRDRLNWIGLMQGLPKIAEANYSLGDYDGWHVPAFYTIAVREKFADSNVVVSNYDKRELGDMDCYHLGLDVGTTAIIMGVNTPPFDPVSMCASYDISRQHMIGHKPMGRSVDVLTRHFDYLGWISYQTSRERIVYGSTSSYLPALESSTVLIPKLRSLKSTPGYSLSNTDEMPCGLFVTNTMVRVDTVNRRPMVINMTLPDPPFNMLGFLGGLAGHAVTVGTRILSGDPLGALSYGLTEALPDLVRRLRNKSEQNEAKEMMNIDVD